MIQADIQKKIGLTIDDPHSEAGKRKMQASEDVLTSNFFGLLKNLSWPVWRAVLPTSITNTESAPPDVQFWKRFPNADLDDVYRNTEPDIVLRFPQSVVFIEVKYLSGFGDNQIQREYVLGSHIANSENSNFHLLTLTRRNKSVADHVKNELECHSLDSVSGVHHLYWETIYEQLSALTEFADDTEKRFVDDLICYLFEKGLTPIDTGVHRTFADYFPSDGSKFLHALRKVVDSFNEEDKNVTIYLDTCNEDQLHSLKEALNILFNSRDIVSAPSNVLTGGVEFLSTYLLQEPDRNNMAKSKRVSDFLYEILSTAYYSRTLCLRATRDFSVSARTKTSGATVISFFTFYQSNRKLVFQLYR